MLNEISSLLNAFKKQINNSEIFRLDDKLSEKYSTKQFTPIEPKLQSQSAPIDINSNNHSRRSQVYELDGQNYHEENYRIINELSTSDYFGEVSLITNLPVTATVHAISNII